MERNMKKNTTRNRAVTALLLALSAALVLAGCFNPLDPIDTAAQAGAGYLSVSIAGQGGGARTLYPNAAFTKYVLTFESEGKSYGSKTLTGTSDATFNDIPVGPWTITATGYVTISGQEYAAAEGSATASIEAGKPASVSIAISATQGGAPGFFYYSVSFPAGKVDTATLTLSQYDASRSDYDKFAPITDPVNLKTSASGYVSGGSGSDLAPGYYRVDITLENAYQRAGISEVVHIYSNMETKAEYTYTEADFVDFVTLSGTIKVDDAALSDGWLDANERRADGSGVFLGNVQVSNGSWALKIPAVSESTEIYFTLSYTNGWVDNIPGITLNPGETTQFSIALNLITLSGTVTATINGEAPSRVEIVATLEEDWRWLASTSLNPDSPDASWSIIVPPFDVGTTVTFGVNFFNASGDNIGYASNNSPTQVHNSAVSNINLNVNYSGITLSGTIGTVTLNGVTYSGEIDITAWNQNNEHLGNIWRDNESGAWYIVISTTNLTSTTSISFRIGIDPDGPGSYQSQEVATYTYTAGQNISGIELGNVSFITLSGTVTATVNGAAPSRVEISAWAESINWIGSTSIDLYSAGASWSISVPAFSEETTVTFDVQLYDSSGYIGSVYDLSSTQVHDSAVSNISLNAKYSTTTLSGTIGTVTVDGAHPYWFGIQAFSRNGNGGEFYGIENGAWSITLSTQNIQSGEEISIIFIASLEDDGPPSIFKPLTTCTYNGGSISDIALGDVAITTRTVSGTATNLPEGTMGAYVVPLSANPDSGSIADGLSDMVGQAMIDVSTGGWSLKVPNTPLSLWFVVMVIVNDGQSTRFFVTNEASGAATVPLDIGAMTELEL